MIHGMQWDEVEIRLEGKASVFKLIGKCFSAFFGLKSNSVSEREIGTPSLKLGESWMMT